MKNPEKIKTMFDNIALKYDFMNNIISFGLHKLIKKCAVKKLDITPESKAVDLCCGTGDISKLLANNFCIKEVIGVDFSGKMLEIAKRKNFDKKIKYINADCTNLPFCDDCFDIVTMFFGLRNIEDKDKAVAEIRRVMKNNGQFLYMDFANGNKIFDFIFDKITPFIANILTKNKDAYEYLINSKKKFLTPKELEKFINNKGLVLKKEYYFLFSTITVQVYSK